VPLEEKQAMDWSELQGHDKQQRWFQQAVRKNRLASTFLFVGTSGIGKRTFARLLAKTLLCQRHPPSQWQPCGQCPSCVQVEASTHPDLLELSRPADRAVLTMEQIAGDREHRGRSGLIFDLHLSSHYGQGKVAILDDADTLHEESANALLKLLEEPPKGVTLFLIATSLQKQLPTIRSRCQIVRFQDLAPSTLAKVLIQQGLVAGSDAISETRSLGAGSVEPWLEGTKEATQTLLQELLRILSTTPIDIVALAKAILEYGEAGGKEGQEKRERMMRGVGIVAELFCGLARDRVGAVPMEGGPSEGILSRPSLSVPMALEAFHLSLGAIEAMGRNVTPASVLESWAADLAWCCRA
jgi:DNA polymerase-3 subunit delta'